MDSRPTLYYDLGSPYAYLAVERAAAVLGVAPRLQPVLVGGIFAARGYGSWAHGPERAARIAELEQRARDYGLPPFAWPTGWPNNTLGAMRAAVWAEQLGAGERFARAAFRRAFTAAADLSQLATLTDLAAQLDLPAAELTTAITSAAVKEELREATARAWERGVAGVPCVEVDGAIFYGDDKLWAAAQRRHDAA